MRTRDVPNGCLDVIDDGTIIRNRWPNHMMDVSEATFWHWAVFVHISAGCEN